MFHPMILAGKCLFMPNSASSLVEGKWRPASATDRPSISTLCPNLRNQSAFSSECNHFMRLLHPRSFKIETISNGPIFSNHVHLLFSWGRMRLAVHSLTTKHHLYLIGPIAQLCITAGILICLLQYLASLRKLFGIQASPPPSCWSQLT